MLPHYQPTGVGCRAQRASTGPPARCPSAFSNGRDQAKDLPDRAKTIRGCLRGLGGLLKEHKKSIKGFGEYARNTAGR